MFGTRRDAPWKACAGLPEHEVGTPPPQPRPRSYLPHGIGEDVDDLLVWGGHHALPVDFNDPMSHADAASLGYPPSHEAADLSKPEVTSPLTAAAHGGERGGDGPVLSGRPLPAFSSLRSCRGDSGDLNLLVSFHNKWGFVGPQGLAPILCTLHGVLSSSPGVMAQSSDSCHPGWGSGERAVWACHQAASSFRLAEYYFPHSSETQTANSIAFEACLLFRVTVTRAKVGPAGRDALLPTFSIQQPVFKLTPHRKDTVAGVRCGTAGHCARGGCGPLEMISPGVEGSGLSLVGPSHPFPPNIF